MNDTSGTPRTPYKRRRLRRTSSPSRAPGARRGRLALNGPTANASAPPPPAGWTQVFVDDFNGAAGTGVNTANWQYATGTGYPGGPANWGTGEIETMTDQHQQRLPRRQRQPPHHPAARRRGQLDLGPHRDQPHRLPAPGRRQAARRVPHPDAERHRRRRPGLLARVLDAGRALPGQLPELAERRRAGHHGERPGPQHRLGHDALRHQPGRPVQRDHRHRRQHRRARARPARPASTPTRMEWDRSTSPEEIRFYLDGINFHTVKANQVDATTWTNATNHGFFIILNVAMGGGFPDAFGGGPDGGTVPGHPMVVDYVQVLQAGGSGTTPPPTGNRDAYSAIQAESYDSQSGTSTETTTDTGGGQDIGSLANGDWALYKGVNFGSTAATQFVARVACGAAAGSAVWSRCASTAVRAHRSAASRSPTPAAGRAGGRSRRTSAASPAPMTSI